MWAHLNLCISSWGDYQYQDSKEAKNNPDLESPIRWVCTSVYPLSLMLKISWVPYSYLGIVIREDLSLRDAVKVPNASVGLEYKFAHHPASLDFKFDSRNARDVCTWSQRSLTLLYSLLLNLNVVGTLPRIQEIHKHGGKNRAYGAVPLFTIIHLRSQYSSVIPKYLISMNL